jgi:hypothetical protein
MGIGSFLKREVKGFTSGITAQDGLQDWAHAARVFAAEDLIRSPKFKGMFHVTFVFNDDVLKGVEEAKAFSETIGSSRKSDVLSVLTKSIDLPNFEIQHTTHNQYNKSTTTYKKILYSPVTITFHDDMSDIVWALWAFYYSWYFADGAKGSGTNSLDANSNNLSKPYENLLGSVVKKVISIFKKPNPEGDTAASAEVPPSASREKSIVEDFPLLLQDWEGTDNSWTDAWGLNGSAYHSVVSDKALHLLKAIKIYPLGNKQASGMTLHYPKIVSWDHDTFDYSAQGTATCKLKLTYDYVTYHDQVSAAGVLQDISFYDKHASSLMRGAPRSLLEPGGILDNSGGVIGNILKGQFGLGDIIQVAGIAKSLSKKGFSTSVKSELKQAAKSAVTNAIINKVFPGSR